jgi:hypothetical protein
VYPFFLGLANHTINHVLIATTPFLRCRFIQPPKDRSRYRNAFDALLHGIDIRAQLKVEKTKKKE